MTVTIHTDQTADGRYNASVAWCKPGGYLLAAYRNNATHIVETCDIVTMRAYATETAALHAMRRTLRKLEQKGESPC